MPPGDTKEKILDEAERLFADHGFSDTSLRDITAGAGVNLAAVNYHFGSKEELIKAVFERRVGPLNRQRLEILDRLETSSEPPALAEVVDAFIDPPLRICCEGSPIFMRLFGQTYSHPDANLTRIMVEQFREVAFRFGRAIHRAVPHLDEHDVFWRLVFMVGSMAHSLALTEMVPKIAGEQHRIESVEEFKAHLIPFLVAGLSAPATPRQASAKTTDRGGNR
ncbi:hypothetical protein ABI59_11870 [Acidobacteria bacterium Mor1]|nr:hypothetical protein ABI59_11870 [Acidobacteria bacterium Mor1]